MGKDQFSHPKKKNVISGHHLSRSDFLKIAGSGVFIFFSSGAIGALSEQRRGRSYPTDFNAYLKIGEDGRVAVYCSKIEMGQGIFTSMAQMLAEELDVNFDSVEMVMGDTSLCPWDGGTTGSRSTKYFGPALRKAGANARAVLLQMAAKYLNRPIKQLLVKNGVVYDKSNEKAKISYGELTKGKQINRLVSEAPLKPFSQHTISGVAKKRTDAGKKITGEAKFTGDIQLPGILYAKIMRPPAHDASLTSVDTSKVHTVEEIILVQEDGLIAVLHENPELAEKARNLISAKWEVPEPKVDNQTVFNHLKKEAPDGRVHEENGNLSAGYLKAKQQLKSEFYNHYVAHAPIEPYTVLAHVDNDKATVWASTQAPFRVRSNAAEALNIPEENVHVITPFLGGGFGGKKSGQQIVEAVKLSKITGRPVQLAWTRKEEFFYDAFRPAAVIQMKTGIDDNGLITFWECDILFTGSRSSEPIYNIPAYRVSTKSAGNVHPFATGAWRGPGSNTNVFAMESQTDMMAQAAGLDPLQFRLKNLKDKRMIRVLNSAAQKFGENFVKGPSGNGYGIACTNYLNTYVATIAHVNVDKSTGRISVERVVCAQDMGEIINPEGAKLQIEGGITMGISATLFEEIQFSGGEIKTENFDTYEIARFSHAPRIETVLINNPDLPPQGCGEPAITTVGAALANAVYDAVGARVFTLPLTPKRILSELK